MKIDAKIEWMIDDSVLGIEVCKSESVPIDMDYVEDNEESIEEAVCQELANRYGTKFTVSKCEDDGDFIINNMNELLEELAFDDFNRRTQYSGV